MAKITNTIRQLEGFRGQHTNFIAVSRNAYVECDENGELKFDRGEVEIAKFFGKEFTDQEIRLTIGPWRSWDMTGELSHDRKVITLDVYSVRVPRVDGECVTALVNNTHKLLSGKKLSFEEIEIDRWMLYGVKRNSNVRSSSG